MISADVFSDDKIIHKNGRSVKIAPAINMAYFNTSATAVVLFGIILVLTFVQRKLTGRKDG